MIKKITIENIKGISNKIFELNITPNKPSLVVAPNGFGKSSFAIAFQSLNSKRIKLDDDNLHRNSTTLEPKILIEYKKEDGSILNLEATKNSNTISQDIDYFVINNQLTPRSIGSLYGRSSAVLDINDIVLVEKIPENIQFPYQFRQYQQKFGQNSKILPNASTLFQNKVLIEKISENYTSLERANGSSFQKKINNVIDKINNITTSTTSEHMMSLVQASLLQELQEISYLSNIANLIYTHDLKLNPTSEIKAYLLAIQCVWLYNNNKEIFKKSCSYSNYLLDKEKFDTTLTQLNSTWKDIKTSQTNGKLIIKFPKAIEISNGQRDILTFISMLFQAQRNLKKTSNILIIDEVFDYLDDANLIAAQYYITQLIKEYKKSGKRIYPIILTHLNPLYFKNYAFSDQKVYFLNKTSAIVNDGLKLLLRNREDISIKDDVSKYLLHYHPDSINKRNEFRALSIPELWGENTNFQTFTTQEIEKYINNLPYCPFAVCSAVRNKIEEIAYMRLEISVHKQEFLRTWKTREKLDFLLSKGITSPETHYLLGIIYNEGMHWKENIDITTPITNKLENLIIKKMIEEIFK